MNLPVRVEECSLSVREEGYARPVRARRIVASDDEQIVAPTEAGNGTYYFDRIAKALNRQAAADKLAEALEGEAYSFILEQASGRAHQDSFDWENFLKFKAEIATALSAYREAAK